MNRGNLLINEPPLQVLPTLAMQIGLNEAVALQQLHFWLGNKKSGIELEGFKWIYNTIEEWQSESFPFWSCRTVQRTFRSLEDMGVVISKQFDSYDRKKYYRIDYDKLESTIMPSWHDGTCQDGTEEGDKLASSSITETPETTSGLSDEEKEQANAKMDAILEEARKAQASYILRSSIPEPLLVYCDLFVKLTHLKPTKKNVNDWLATFSEWKSEGLQPADIQAAWQKANPEVGNGFTVTRPGSLTGTAIAHKAKSDSSAAAKPKHDPNRVIRVATDEEVAAAYAEMYKPSAIPEDIRQKIEAFKARNNAKR